MFGLTCCAVCRVFVTQSCSSAAPCTAVCHSWRQSRACTGRSPSLTAPLSALGDDQRGFLPCPVPQEDEFDQGVCEIHQPALGYAGDPEPVVQYVQVHVSRAACLWGLCARGGERRLVASRLIIIQMLNIDPGWRDEHYRQTSGCARLTSRKHIRRNPTPAAPAARLLYIQMQGQPRGHAPRS